eukprot:scaffold3376_cov64-Cylindrotheca_fusiformis.AAC.1
MLVISAFQKLLLAFKYPDFSSDLVGPYNSVGVIQRRIPGSTGSQIFYPTTTTTTRNQDEKKKKKKQSSYFRPQAIRGLADYSGQSSEELFQFLSKATHPCIVDATPPIATSSNDNHDNGTSSSSLPLVIFSHGLGGCMEMYTDLCQQIASSGMIVVALEHEDGSGCYAETKDGKEILYQRPDDTPYSRQKVVNFRRPFLKQRVHEISIAMDFFLGEDWKINNNNHDEIDPLFRQVLECIDPSKGAALVGHSFGGASMALLASNMADDKERMNGGPSSKNIINSVTMFDPWAFALDDETIQERGIPKSISILSILSENWAMTNPETQQILELHHPNVKDENDDDPLLLYYMPRSVHPSFSDAGWWLPRFLTRRMGLRGTKERRYETIQSCAKACIYHIQQQCCTSSTTTNDADALGKPKRTDNEDYYSTSLQLMPFPLTEGDDKDSTTTISNEQVEMAKAR